MRHTRSTVHACAYAYAWDYAYAYSWAYAWAYSWAYGGAVTDLPPVIDDTFDPLVGGDLRATPVQ